MSDDEGMPPELPRLDSRIELLPSDGPSEASSATDLPALGDRGGAESDEEEIGDAPPPDLVPLSSRQEVENAWEALDSEAYGHVGDVGETGESSESEDASTAGEDADVSFGASPPQTLSASPPALGAEHLLAEDASSPGENRPSDSASGASGDCVGTNNCGGSQNGSGGGGGNGGSNGRRRSRESDAVLYASASPASGPTSPAAATVASAKQHGSSAGTAGSNAGSAWRHISFGRRKSGGWGLRMDGGDTGSTWELKIGGASIADLVETVPALAAAADVTASGDSAAATATQGDLNGDECAAALGDAGEEAGVLLTPSAAAAGGAVAGSGDEAAGSPLKGPLEEEERVVDGDTAAATSAVADASSSGGAAVGKKKGDISSVAAAAAAAFAGVNMTGTGADEAEPAQSAAVDVTDARETASLFVPAAAEEELEETPAANGVAHAAPTAGAASETTLAATEDNFGGLDKADGGTAATGVAAEDVEAAAEEAAAPLDDMALHRAVFEGDEAAVRDVLKRRRDLLDVRDHRGHTPLLLAVKLGHVAIGHILVEAGANVDVSVGGFSLLDEAILAADEVLLVRIYTILQRGHWLRWREKVLTLLEATENMPDFHLTMDWAFECNNLLAPFVKAMAPSDTYSVWKHGSWIRVDCTITGFGKRFRAERGSISLLLAGRGSPVPGTLLKLDHGKRKTYSVLRRLDNPSATELRRACRRFMAAERRSKAVEAFDWSASDLQFAPTNDRRGRQRTGNVEGWDCLRYEVTGDLKFQSFRKQGDEQAELRGMPLGVYMAEAAQSKQQHLQQPHKKFEKRLKTDLWMSKDFPLLIQHVLPILEILAMQDSIVSKLRDVLNANGVQKAGFPVRVSLPLYLGCSWVVVFRHCEVGPQDASLFHIPADYSFSKHMRQAELWKGAQMGGAANGLAVDSASRASSEANFHAVSIDTPAPQKHASKPLAKEASTAASESESAASFDE